MLLLAWLVWDRDVIFDGWVPFRLIWASAKLSWARFWGFRTIATPVEQEKRLDQCNSCEELTPNRQCRVCKCFVDEKTLLTTEKCPINKWWPIWKHDHTVR